MDENGFRNGLKMILKWIKIERKILLTNMHRPIPYC